MRRQSITRLIDLAVPPCGGSCRPTKLLTAGSNLGFQGRVSKLPVRHELRVNSCRDLLGDVWWKEHLCSRGLGPAFERLKTGAGNWPARDRGV
jgi:hypothetical protein